ncbi:Vacuole effluxer Atg22 like domain containing protein [Lactarius tabidus]
MRYILSCEITEHPQISETRMIGDHIIIELQASNASGPVVHDAALVALHFSCGYNTESRRATVQIMTLVFATIGPVADYRTYGRWLLLISTAICWAAQFASISLTSPSRWGTAMALYMISFTSQGIVIAFFAALFPQLACNSSHSRELRKRCEQGELSPEAYEKEKAIEMSKISSVSMIWHFFGNIVASSLNLALLLPLNHNPRVDNYVIVLTTGYWVLFGIWWYRGTNVGEAARITMTLTQFYWQGLGTALTLVSICQNEQFAFSFLQNTYLNLYGLVVGPNYSIAQTLMGELTPPGFEYMAIIRKSGNNWKAFPFLFVLSALGCLVAWIGINVPRGRHAAAQWSTEKRRTGDGTGFLHEKDHREFPESRSEGKSDGKI